MNSIKQGQGPSVKVTHAETLTDWEIALEGSFQRYMTESQRRIMLETHARAKTPGLLLDFGCGPGRWTKFMMDRGWQAICVDVDAESLGRCQATNPSAKCILSTTKLQIGRASCRERV